MRTFGTAVFRRTGLIAGMSAMGTVVLAANIAVNYPINNWLTWGALIYPIAFLVTDLVNRIFGPKPARKVVYAGFAVGVALSLWFADQRIALASGTAFLTAQLLDIWVFDRLRRKSWWKAPVISSLLSSALDTALFFSLAFYATGVPWITLAIGDYGAKLVMAAVLLVPFRAFISLLPQRFDQRETITDAAQ